jgi:hypothetical protein
MNSDDPADYPAIARGALESAITALERSLRADGAFSGDIPEGERAGWEWRALFRWAEETGFIFPSEIAPARQGGREHDLDWNWMF